MTYILERRRKSRRRVYPLINSLFCHELFTHVFIMLEYVDLVRAAYVCSLWRNHIKEMQGTLFRHFYIHLGGDPNTRRGQVECWKKEVRMIVHCETDLTLYHYALRNEDEVLKHSIINDGGFCMDLCKHIVKKGGTIPPSELVLDFKKRLSTQTAKWEFYDIVNALCYLQEITNIMNNNGDERCDRFCLRAIVDNGALLRQLRALFLEYGSSVETSTITSFIKEYIRSLKLIDDAATRTEVWNVVKIMAGTLDQEQWVLRKVEPSKRLFHGNNLFL